MLQCSHIRLISLGWKMRKWIILGGAMGSAILIDRLSKGWVIANLELYESIQPIPFLASWFQLTRSANTGAAFGLLPMAGNVFLLLALGIIGVMLWHFRDTSDEARFVPFAIGIVIGGAIGNVIDRLQYGHVIDFIHYQIPNLISNVSNLADHAIVCGTVFIIGEGLRRDYQAKKRGRPWARDASGAAESKSSDGL